MNGGGGEIGRSYWSNTCRSRSTNWGRRSNGSSWANRSGWTNGSSWTGGGTGAAVASRLWSLR